VTIEEQCDKTHSREEFVNFVRALHQEYLDNPGAWENWDLDSYLEALAGWASDMHGYYLNQGKPVPQQSDWNVTARMLLAATNYE